MTYQSTAESIEFDLEVNDGSGGVAKESILAVVPPANAAPQAAHEQIAIVKTQVIPQPPPPKVQAPAVVEVPQAIPVKARAFVPPPTQTKSVQSAIIDAPPALANAPAAPVGVNYRRHSRRYRATSRRAATSSGGKHFASGQLDQESCPGLSATGETAGVQGVVRFTAVVGKDGKIQNLKVISGPPPLVDAASEAVKRWVYRPTLLNGQPVEVITEISVNFTIRGPPLGHFIAAPAWWSPSAARSRLFSLQEYSINSGNRGESLRGL